MTAEDQVGWAVVSNRSKLVLARYKLDGQTEAEEHCAELVDDAGKRWTRVAPWFKDGGTRGK